MLVALTVLSAIAAPQIDVYTMGRGEALYERFGHAAVCVSDAESARDARCYNFGTTDFGSPPAELGWHFLRGSARFWVSVSPRREMLKSYERADRTVWKQRLPLSPNEARAVARLLDVSARPENREYVYHHLDDNCSTRVRDIIDAATHGALSSNREERIGPTYRELGRTRLGDEPLAAILADVFVGRRADLSPTGRQAMFLPEFLRRALSERFGVDAEVVFRRRAEAVPLGRTAPWLAFLGVAGATALAASSSRWMTRLRARRIGFFVAMSFTSIVGLAVWTIATFTAVPELRANEALAVFVPTDVLAVVLPAPWRERYVRFRICELVAVSALLATGLFRQPLLAAVLIPLAPMLIAAEGRPFFYRFFGNESQ